MQWTDRIGRRLKLRDLHILLAVAECGSISKAAKHLAISHPVVSKTISDLEHMLGVQLLDRTSRGAEPTVFGRALLDCGTTVFDELQQGVRRIDTRRSNGGRIAGRKHRAPDGRAHSSGD
jgi:molybdate transport repressor ModE-like protein